MLRCVEVVGKVHAYLPSEAYMIWDEFFAAYHKDADGTLYGGPEVYEATKEGYLLKVSVPGAESAEVKRCGQDLEIRVGNQLRIIPLPSTLCRAQIVKTEVKEGVLQAAFSLGQEAP